MYKIDFYRDENGESDTANFINSLVLASETNKDARIQYNQLSSQMKLLREKGTNLPTNITKHICEDIWELCPGHNRVFYFCWLGDTFVLLHHFRKKTDKTPVNEIEKAKKERNDYIRRHK